MKLAILNLLLLAVTVSARSQERTVRVRLFWQHPPDRIHVVPELASLRECDSCKPVPLQGAIEVAAKASTVTAVALTSQTITLIGRARISGSDFSPFAVNSELRIQAREGSLLLTLSLPLEQYVTAVLQGESAGFKSEEALKAMAVAARTYAVHFGSRHRLEGFDFCDTTHCQDLRLGNESPRARAATLATSGELLWFEGRPAATYYHRNCGGELEDASMLEPELRLPYLQRHHDSYCIRTPDEWHTQITKDDLAQVLGHSITRITIASRSESGRVQTLVIDGRLMSAVDFRLAIGRALGWDRLRSDLYEEEDLGDRIAFRGRGEGHGVGLCQAGAESMGELQHSYREILAYYYPGTVLGVNAQGLAWERLPGESLDLITTNRGDAAVLLPVAERALHIAIERTGWEIGLRPQIKVYPTIAIYRDATGEPGWVAASTAGSIVRLQPISKLEQTHSLESTLRHEFLHMLIESNARAGTPLWFREGLVVYLTDDSPSPAGITMSGETIDRVIGAPQENQSMRQAYRQAAALIRELDGQYGRAKLMEWLRSGLPDDVRQEYMPAERHNLSH